MVSRRSILVAGGALASALLGGCLGSGGGGSDRVTVAEPDGDGDPTPGELRWLLTNEPNTVDVTQMRVDGDRIDVTFASAAGTLTAFLDEVGTVLDEYATYVEQGGSAARLTAHVTDRETTGYEGNGDRGQAASFHVEREWAVEYNAGELTDRQYLQRVLETRSWEGGS